VEEHKERETVLASTLNSALQDAAADSAQWLHTMTFEQLSNSPSLSVPLRIPHAMANPSTAGPSRMPPRLAQPPPAPSTSGDSESTAPQPVQKGLDVGVLKELAKTALVERLNDVGEAVLLHLPRPEMQLERAHETQIQGAKTLILDPTLAGPLGLVTEVALLKVSHGETRQQHIAR
jgi:hypothetical protein